MRVPVVRAPTHQLAHRRPRLAVRGTQSWLGELLFEVLQDCHRLGHDEAFVLQNRDLRKGVELQKFLREETGILLDADGDTGFAQVYRSPWSEMARRGLGTETLGVSNFDPVVPSNTFGECVTEFFALAVDINDGPCSASTNGDDCINAGETLDDRCGGFLQQCRPGSLDLDDEVTYIAVETPDPDRVYDVCIVGADDRLYHPSYDRTEPTNNHRSALPTLHVYRVRHDSAVCVFR